MNKKRNVPSDGKPNDVEQDENKASATLRAVEKSPHRSLKFDRRNFVQVLGTSALFATLSSGIATADEDIADVSAAHVAGSNPHGHPESLYFDPSSSAIEISTEDLNVTDRLWARIHMRPTEGSSNYEEIASATFSAEGSEDITINENQFQSTMTDLREHSDVSDSDFEIDPTDLESLDDHENRTRHKEFELRVTIEDNQGNKLEEATDTFIAEYGLQGGVGNNIGYQVGQKYPPSEAYVLHREHGLSI